MPRLKHFLGSTYCARIVGFLWGYAEGVLFFIVPDVYITFATLFSIRAGLTAWGYSILGSLASVATVFLLVMHAPDTYLGVLSQVPGISASMLAHVEATLAVTGLPYTPLLVLGGVPLKVYTSSAFLLGYSFLSVFVWAIFARLVRIAPVFALIVVIRRAFSRSIGKVPTLWALALLIAWILFYTYYFTLMH